MATTRDNELRKSLFDRVILGLEVLIGLGVVVAIIGGKYGAAPTVVFFLCAISVAYSAWALYKTVAVLSDDSLDVAQKIQDSEREALEEEKYLLLTGIKELEADAGVGKVDAKDYAHLRRTAEGRAVQIIQNLKATDDKYLAMARKLASERLGRPLPEPPARQEGSEKAKKEVLPAIFDDRSVAMQAGKADRLVCSGCQTENESDARYCIGCGRPRADDASGAVEKTDAGADVGAETPPRAEESA